MQKLRTKLDMAYIKAKNWISTKKEGSDQLMVMFIIIAVAAGVAGLLYIFAKSTCFILSIHLKGRIYRNSKRSWVSDVCKFRCKFPYNRRAA